LRRWSAQSQPDVALAGPAFRAIAVVGELADGIAFLPVALDRLAAHHVGDLGEALVRPSRQLHRLAAEEQFDALGRGHGITKVGHTGGLEIGLHDLAASSRFEPVENRPIGNRPELSDPLAAQQAHLLILVGPVCDRHRLAAAVLGHKLKRLVEMVVPAADPDGDAGG